MHKSSVFAVVVTFNGASWIGPCLQSLRKSEYQLNTIVVDNCSTDETVSLIRNGYPEVDVIENHKNLGFGAANNIGIQRALSMNAEYVLLINQDAKVHPDMVGRLVQVGENSASAGVLVPMQLTYDGRAVESYFVDYLRGVPEFVSDLFLGRLLECYPIEFAPAALWLVRCSLLRQIGGFDPLFFMYGEDVDFCHRVRAAGAQVKLVPSAIGYHWHGGPDQIQSIKELKNDIYWSAVMLLKDPERSPLRSVITVMQEFQPRALHKLFYLDVSRFFAIEKGLFSALATVPKLMRRRRLGQGDAELAFADKS